MESEDQKLQETPVLSGFNVEHEELDEEVLSAKKGPTLGFFGTFKSYSDALWWVDLFETIVYSFSVFIVLLFIAYWIIYYMLISGAALTSYNTDVGRTGMFVHILPGSVYHLTGTLQFCASLRRFAPKVHRVLGYVYYGAQVVASLGVLIIIFGATSTAAGFSGRASGLVGVSLWSVWSWSALKNAIAGNIVQHRKDNLLAFTLGSSIIWIRIFFIILYILTGEERQQVLAYCMWFAPATLLIFATFFLSIEDSCRPKFGALSDGTVAINGGNSALGPMYHRVKIVEARLLNSRTISMRLKVKTPGSVILSSPCEHIALKLKLSANKDPITRNFTPVTDAEDMKRGYVDLLIRLVPNGQMSSLLSQICSPEGLKKVELSEVSGPFGTHFDYEPNYFETVTVIAGGTGLTTFVNLIRVIVRSKTDRTRVCLMFLNRAQEEVFFEKELTQLAESSDVLAGGHKKLEFVKLTSRDDLTPEVAQKSLAPPDPRHQVLVCGTVPMLKHVRSNVLGPLGHKRVYCFGLDDR